MVDGPNLTNSLSISRRQAKRYQASAGNKAKTSKIRAIWGKVTRPHGGRLRSACGPKRRAPD